MNPTRSHPAGMHQGAAGVGAADNDDEDEVAAAVVVVAAVAPIPSTALAKRWCLDSDTMVSNSGSLLSTAIGASTDFCTATAAL